MNKNDYLSVGKYIGSAYNVTVQTMICILQSHCDVYDGSRLQRIKAN